MADRSQTWTSVVFFVSCVLLVCGFVGLVAYAIVATERDRARCESVPGQVYVRTYHGLACIRSGAGQAD